MKIVLLIDHPELCQALALWSHREWSYFHPERTMSEAIAIMATRANHSHLPLGLVAMDGSQPVGMVFLKEQDLGSHPHLTPWLAGLYVDMAWRGKGIGTRLVQAAERKATELGCIRLLLFAPDAMDFYKKTGWQEYGMAGEFVIFDKNLC